MNTICKAAALAIAMLALARPAAADDAWRATHTLLPGDTIRGDDIIAQAQTGFGRDVVPATRDIVGLEIKRRVYQGREITLRDIGPRSAVKANTPVRVMWKSGGLTLELDARALEAGAVGDEIRVLNPTTSRTIRGIVVADGMVEIRSQP